MNNNPIIFEKTDDYEEMNLANVLDVMDDDEFGEYLSGLLDMKRIISYGGSKEFIKAFKKEFETQVQWLKKNLRPVVEEWTPKPRKEVTGIEFIG